MTDYKTENLDEPEILDETSANWYVLLPDGTTQNIAKSPENRLLYEHNLFGLLREGGETLVLNSTGEGRTVQIRANENATEFDLDVGVGQPLHLGAHQKSRLVEALMEVYEMGVEVTPLVSLYDTIRKNMVRPEVVNRLARRKPFVHAVETEADGWLIHNHLLLTWEGDLHHPNTTAYDRQGNTVAEGSSEIAYDLRIRSPDPDGQREFTLEGEKYRLTDSEMEFVAKATWGLKYAPKMKEESDE